MSRSITANNLRPLTEYEINVLVVALQRLAKDSTYGNQALSMLEQKMPHNFFWATQEASHA